jgi:hypothetical protein
VFAAQRLEAYVRAGEGDRPGIELRPDPADHVGHLHVIGPGSFVGHHTVALDPLDLEARRSVGRDRAVVEREDAERDAVDLQVVDQVPYQEAQRLAAEALAP